MGAVIFNRNSVKSINGVALAGYGDVSLDTLGIQPILKSGTNIKTVVSKPILGSGNVNIAFLDIDGIPINNGAKRARIQQGGSTDARNASLNIYLYDYASGSYTNAKSVGILVNSSGVRNWATPSELTAVNNDLTAAKQDIASAQANIATAQVNIARLTTTTASLENTKVARTQKINNKALQGNITLAAGDIKFSSVDGTVNTVDTVRTYAKPSTKSKFTGTGSALTGVQLFLDKAGYVVSGYVYVRIKSVPTNDGWSTVTLFKSTTLNSKRATYLPAVSVAGSGVSTYAKIEPTGTTTGGIKLFVRSTMKVNDEYIIPISYISANSSYISAIENE